MLFCPMFLTWQQRVAHLETQLCVHTVPITTALYCLSLKPHCDLIVFANVEI